MKSGKSLEPINETNYVTKYDSCLIKSGKSLEPINKTKNGTKSGCCVIL